MTYKHGAVNSFVSKFIFFYFFLNQGINIVNSPKLALYWCENISSEIKIT